MKYVAEGPIMTNRLIFPDGRIIDKVMGGTGFYAYSGLRMCTKECLLAAGVGEDFDLYYGKWFDDNLCSKAALKKTVRWTTFNELAYENSGIYNETSIYGEEYDKENFPKTLLNIKDYRKHLLDAKGLYTCVNPSMEFEEGVKGLGLQIMWEIPVNQIPLFAEHYKRGGLDAIAEQIAPFTMISLNRPESYKIFGTNNTDEALRLLESLNKPVYYRMGNDGAVFIDRGIKHFIPLINTVQIAAEVDPTGCGNSSTAAVLWAYCEGYDSLMAGIIGGVVASFNVRQYGPFPLITEDTTRQVLGWADRICSSMKNGKEVRI